MDRRLILLYNFLISLQPKWNKIWGFSILLFPNFYLYSASKWNSSLKVTGSSLELGESEVLGLLSLITCSVLCFSVVVILLVLCDCELYISSSHILLFLNVNHWLNYWNLVIKTSGIFYVLCKSWEFCIED